MYDLRLGDCLEVMQSLPDHSIDLVLCDLPYGTTQCSWDVVIPLKPLWEQYRRLIKPNGAIVLTAQQPFANQLVASNREWFRYEWIWVKPQGTGFLNAKKMPLKKHENVLVFYGKLPTYNPQFTTGTPYRSRGGKKCPPIYHVRTAAPAVDNRGTRYPVDILEFGRDREKLHPTQKPVALMEYMVRTYTDAGEVVLDNAFGSGTTGVACGRSGRRFIGIERDPNYFQIGLDRIRTAYRSSL